MLLFRNQLFRSSKILLVHVSSVLLRRGNRFSSVELIGVIISLLGTQNIPDFIVIKCHFGGTLFGFKDINDRVPVELPSLSSFFFTNVDWRFVVLLYLEFLSSIYFLLG